MSQLDARRTTATLVVGMLLPVVAGLALATPARAAGSAAAVSLSPFSALSNGAIAYANAADLPGLDVASAEIAQSAAGVAHASALATSDQLGVPLASKTSTTGYGRAAGVGVGLLQSQTVPAQVQLTQADATPGTAATGDALPVSLAPLATADVLPGSASASPLASATSCPATGSVLSTGTSQVAHANALTAGAVSVLALGGTSENTSTTKLVSAPAGQGLQSQTVSTIAPITLFAGTPAALSLDVLTPIALTTVAGGAAGTAHVTYGAVQTVDGVVTPVGASTPVLTITTVGGSQTLTSQELFGNGGIDLALGIADLTIGTPAHSLTGSDGSAVTQSATGTTASAAADFIRVTVPGTSSVPTTNPVGGPLGSLLNPILNPVTTALTPVLSALQSTLASAGLDVADVRVGHLESSSTVPAGGILCTRAVTPTAPTGPTAPGTNPLGGSRKDVASTDVAPGQTFTYDVRIPNGGTSTITNLTVTDTPSAALEFVSSTPAPSSRSGSALTYDLGSLAAGGFDTIVLTFRAPAGTTEGTVFHNSATITGTYAGAPVSTTTTVTGPTAEPIPTGTGGVCHVEATLFASNTQVAPGEEYAYMVNVQDVGGAPCTSVTVTDPVPGGTTFAGCEGTCTHTGTTVTWPIGTLQPGQSTVVGLLVKTTAASGPIIDTAVVTATGTDAVHLSTDEPDVTGTSVVRGGDPVPGFAAAPLADAGAGLAFTGLSAGVPLAALALLGAGAVCLALRRRTSVR